MTKFRVSTAGGETLEVESDERLGAILDELKEHGYAFGSEVSNGKGEPVDEDYEPEEGEVISSHETPAGN